MHVYVTMYFGEKGNFFPLLSLLIDKCCAARERERKQKIERLHNPALLHSTFFPVRTPVLSLTFHGGAPPHFDSTERT